MTRSFLTLLILLLAALLGLSTNAQARCFENEADVRLCWNPVNPLPDIADFRDILWNGERHIAVGDAGVVLTSPEGEVWTAQDSGSTQQIYSIIQDNNRLVAVGEGGLVLTSPDGFEWTSQPSNIRQPLFDLTWNNDPGNPVYVAVGPSGTIITGRNATDGTEAILWESTTPWLPNASKPNLSGVTWWNAGGRFVAVGNRSAIVTSTDGVNWTIVQYIRDGGSDHYRAVTAIDSRLVAVTDAGEIHYSDDPNAAADSWVKASSGVPVDDTTPLRNIVQDNGMLVAVGGDNSGNVILVNREGDAVNWVDVTPSSPSSRLLSIAFNGSDSDWVAVGDGVLLRSEDAGLQGGGGQWTTVGEAATGANLNGLLADGPAGAAYITVGSGGTLLTSTDGLTWIDRVSGTINPLNAITWNEGPDDNLVFITVGDSGTALASNDGINWTSSSTGISPFLNLRDIAWGGSGNGRFIAVGTNGGIVHSSDGDQWDPSSITSNTLNAITWSDVLNQWVAVGDSGTVLYSSSGINWNTGSPPSGFDEDLHDIAYGAGRFVAVGGDANQSGSSDPVILVSDDGITWSELSEFFVNPEDSNALLSIVWNGNQFLAADNSTGFMRSSDGEDWGPLNREGGETPLNALAWDGERIFAVGGNGWILHSGGVDLSINIESTVSDSPPGFVPRANAGLTFSISITNISSLDARNVLFIFDEVNADESIPGVPNSDIFQNTSSRLLTQFGQDLNWECDDTSTDGEVRCLTNRMPASDLINSSILIEINTTPNNIGSVTSSASVTPDGNQTPDINTANNEILIATDIRPGTTGPFDDPDAQLGSSGLGSLQGWHLFVLALLILVFPPLRSRLGFSPNRPI